MLYEVITNINIVETLVALKLNATQQLTTTFTPANATNQSVTWKSSVITSYSIHYTKLYDVYAVFTTPFKGFATHLNPP